MRHHRAQLVRNPGWVTEIIASAYEMLEDTVEPQWLPRLDHVEGQGSTVSGRLQEYGCGAYGCVFPTLDPTVVMKVTTDDTEAEFAANLAATLERPICVNYHTVIGLNAVHDGRKVYLLWRDSAEYVGKIVDVLDERGDGDLAESYISEQHMRAQLAFRSLAEVQDAIALRGRTPRSASKKRSSSRLGLMAGSWSAKTWPSRRRSRELAELGRGLVHVFRHQGIFFGDIHAGNLGLVHRNGDRWVITDPGHVAVVDESTRGS